MVQSKAASVDDFMIEVSPDRRPALDRLRALCRETFGARHELMAFGMPAYGDPKAPWIAFNSQKQYIALYAGQGAIERSENASARPAAARAASAGASPTRWTSRSSPTSWPT
jgi:uncharacterized protein YdhG (YjbR/CyaY superfamily)